MTVLSQILNADRGLVFRITHIENLPVIAQQGLVCRSDCDPGSPFRTIGKLEVIEKRRSIAVTAGPGGCLDDYVPF